MNVTRENLDGQTALLKVAVTAADYTESVEKALREYKRKANVPGFRPGMVPMGVVNKMYRKGVIAEESYRIASRACFDYLEKEKINYIGDVLPSDSQKALDFDNDTEFEFAFEVGMAPEVNISLSNKDVVERYSIKPSKDMREGYRSNYLRRFGRLVDVEKVEKDEALNVVLDNADMNITDAYVGLIGMSDEERAPFIGKKEGDQMQVNVNELYKTPAQRAAVLQVKEHELEGIDPVFNLTITKIRKFAEPEVNEEFFKMAFPEGEVKNAKEFDAWIDSQIERELSTHTDELFERSVQKMLMDKAALAMPVEFLKRWLYTINEGKFTMEQIEQDFDSFLQMMRWNIIRQHYVALLNLAVTKEEMLDEAKQSTRTQFAQYGMPSAPDDMVENYANQMLANKEEARKIEDKLMEHKVIEAIVPMIKITDKAVSPEDFGKKVEELNK